MRKASPTPIKNILMGAIEDIISKKEGVPTQEEIDAAWVESAGVAARRHSTPARINRNTLVVNVDSPTWIYQLNMQKAGIEKKLNKILHPKDPIKIRLRAGEE